MLTRTQKVRLGIFLLVGLLLFCAGGLVAGHAKEGSAEQSLQIMIGSEPDTLTGGGQSPNEDSAGDPDDVDFGLPLTLWFGRWLFHF